MFNDWFICFACGVVRALFVPVLYGEFFWSYSARGVVWVLFVWRVVWLGCCCLFCMWCGQGFVCLACGVSCSDLSDSRPVMHGIMDVSMP